MIDPFTMNHSCNAASRSRRTGVRRIGDWALQVTTQALLLAIILLACSIEASSQTCSVAANNLVFGTYDPTANSILDTTSSMTVSCSGFPALSDVRVCIGVYDSSSPRMMTSSSSATLVYAFYKDAAHTQPWGYYTLNGTRRQVDMTVNASGSASTVVTVYGRISAGQQTAPPGAYSRSFQPWDTLASYGSPPSTVDCATSYAPYAQLPFTVSTTVNPTCSVSATNMDFGSAGLIATSIDTTGSVSVLCTNTTPYNIGLGVGIGAGASVAARKMTQGGGGTVTYSLYRDAARSQVWGNTVGTDTVAGTGTGYAQNVTVYGRVPAQAGAAVGTYSDTITVTVTY